MPNSSSVRIRGGGITTTKVALCDRYVKYPLGVYWLAWPTESPERGYSDNKKQLINRLRRLEGQVRGVQRMVEEDAWCPDVLNQVAAVRSALDKVALGLAEGHVRHCMVGGADDPSAGRDDGRADDGDRPFGPLARPPLRRAPGR